MFIAYRNHELTSDIIRKQSVNNPVATMISAIMLRAKLDTETVPDRMFDGKMEGDIAAAWVACRSLDHLIDECGDFLRTAADHYRKTMEPVKVGDA